MSVVFSSTIFGILMFYKARKLNANLLAVAGAGTFFTGLIYLGATIDLLCLLIMGNNIFPIYLYAYLCWSWLAPSLISWGYFCPKILLPDKKWNFLRMSYLFATLILTLLFEFFLWFDTQNAIIFDLKSPGEDIIDASFNRNHPIYMIMFISEILSIGMMLGFLIKARDASGILRKKYSFLSVGFLVFITCSALDVFIPPSSIAIGFVRLLLMTFALWMYLGLKEETIDDEQKVKLKKEIHVESDLFRISKLKRESITEEEISISKEKRTYLVCKAKLSRTIYLCPNCGAFYCNKCSQALSNLENACWVCDTPFDDTKPVNISREIDENEIKVDENSDKKN